MLALMSPPPTLPFHHNTLSSTRPSAAKRPKLSLNTNSVPSVFGRPSTSLRLENLSTTSPTARNTFQNAHNSPVQDRETGCNPALPPLSVPTLHATSESAASSATTTTSVFSIDSISSVVPYKLTHKTTSILINSPIPRAPKRAPFARAPTFPATKRVAFREPLTEEVKTTHFTLRHGNDVSPEAPEAPVSTIDLPPSDSLTEQTTEGLNDEHIQETHHRSRPDWPHTGDKRDSSDEEDSEDGPCPATPVAGRRKRQRQWTWTLAKVDSHKPICTHRRAPVEASTSGDSTVVCTL